MPNKVLFCIIRKVHRLMTKYYDYYLISSSLKSRVFCFAELSGVADIMWAAG